VVELYIMHSCYYIAFSCDQRSLASYIKKYACSNAKTEDLWAALEEGSGEPVNKLMTSWTKQKGYPVVSVKVNDQKLEFDQVPLHLDLSFDFYTIMFWEKTHHISCVSFVHLLTVTILVKWCSRRRRMDCSSNIMLWHLWCPQEFPLAIKIWCTWRQRLHWYRRHKWLD